MRGGVRRGGGGPQPSERVSVSAVLPCPAGESLGGVLPNPAVLASLGILTIPAEEGGTSSQAASRVLGETGGEGPSVAPRLKAGSSHNPDKGKQTAPGKTQTAPDQPLVLGEGLPPVPARLVGKIRRGEFLDMAELLRDNIEAERRRGSSADTARGASKGKWREVPDLLSWVQCFGAYICVVANQHPKKLKELVAYQNTLIREARRCGGAGWQGYYNMFRQHAATSQEIDWSKVRRGE